MSKKGQDQPMYDLQIVDSIERIPKAQWNALRPGPFFQHEWFRTIESSGMFNILPRHIIVRQGSEIVAAAPCYIQYEALYYTLEERLGTQLTNLLRKIGVSFSPALLCYSPLSSLSRVLFAPALSSYSQIAILDQILTKMDEQCRRERIPISGFLQVSPSDALLFQTLSNKPLARYSSYPLTYLNIEWESFEDYKKSIEKMSKNMAANIRKEINRAHRANVRMSEEPNFGEMGSALTELFKNVYRKYHQKEGLMPMFFQRLSEYMKQDVKLGVARKEDLLEGFSLTIMRDGVWHVLISGLNATTSQTDRIYFNIAYYFPIAEAIRVKAQRVYFGQTTYEAKIRRGCKLEPLFVFLKCQKTFSLYSALFRTLVYLRDKVNRFKMRDYRSFVAV